jgi:acetyltransferase-like isoleucine patch superfamily enzyme
MAKSLFRRVSNRWLHLLARFCPGADTVRPFLHKLRGVKIKGRVWIGDDVYLENEYPEAIELHDGVVIIVRTIILAHFKGPAKVVVERNVRIGPHCTISPSPGETLIIGEGSMLAAGAVVTKSVPPFTLVGGVPAKPLARITTPLGKGMDYEAWRQGLQPIKKHISSDEKGT